MRDVIALDNFDSYILHTSVNLIPLNNLTGAGDAFILFMRSSKLN